MKNQDWEKYNNCSNCEYRTPCTTDHCRIVGGKPKQKCHFFNLRNVAFNGVIMSMEQIVAVTNEGLFIHPETGEETRVLSGRYKRDNSDVLFFINEDSNREVISISDLLQKWVRV